MGRTHWESFGATVLMVAESAPPGWNRVNVSENLDATLVVPVARVDNPCICYQTKSLLFLQSSR